MSNLIKFNYNAMPKSQAYEEGMNLVEGDTENLRVEIKNDITYATKDGLDLHIRLLKPNNIQKEEDQTKYPLLIHVQGSAWMKQNMNDHVVDFKEIVQAGYMVAIIQYRDSSIVKIPGQVIDVKDAARYLINHKDDIGFDENRMYLSGDSSGGHTALMCWATWPTETNLPKINAFMDFYGVVEFKEFLNQTSAVDHSGPMSPEGMALGKAMDDPECVELAKNASILTYIHQNIQNQPLLVLHGNKDRLVPFEQSILLYQKAKQENKDVTFYAVNNADHGGSAFYCKAVYEIIIGFLNTH